jgi:hypothetical protein
MLRTATLFSLVCAANGAAVCLSAVTTTGPECVAYPKDFKTVNNCTASTTCEAKCLYNRQCRDVEIIGFTNASCTGSYACATTLACRPGAPCSFHCGGSTGCRDGTLVCPGGDEPCTIDCVDGCYKVRTYALTRTHTHTHAHTHTRTDQVRVRRIPMSGRNYRVQHFWRLCW